MDHSHKYNTARLQTQPHTTPTKPQTSTKNNVQDKQHIRRSMQAI